MSKTAILCDFCSTRFEKRNADIARTKSHFCSKKCSKLGQRNRIIVSCNYCGENVERKPSEISETNFCNRSCSASYHNSVSPKRDKGVHYENDHNGNVYKIKRPEKKCITCKCPMSHTHKKFCSHRCYSVNRRTIIMNKIKSSNLLTTNNTHRCTESMKSCLAEIQGPNCSICQQKPFWNNKPMIMILDHINGVSNDWRLENVRLVCPNCDTQLDTFKSRNKNGNRPR